MSSISVERHKAANRRRPPASMTSQGESPTPARQAAGEARISDGSRQLVPIDHRLLAKALTIRRTEERLLALFAENKVSGTVHTCIGQEWIGVAVAEALEPGDAIFSNHRGHGHYLARTDDVEGLVAELLGRSTGVCGGRGGSQHLCRDGFFSNGIQGGIVPVAGGLAMARRLAHTHHIAAVFIGDGTLGEGVVYETLNLAARWSLPLLIILEDNGIAQSTFQEDVLAGTIEGRADAFGIEVRHADTQDPCELIFEAAEAVQHVRRTSRPLLLQVNTCRLRAHSKGDDDRDPVAIAQWAERDTLNRIIAQDAPVTRELLSAIDRRLDAAVTEASAAPLAVVTGDGGDNQHVSTSPSAWRVMTFERQRVVDAIRRALGDAMAGDERIVLLGEDIGDPYGGAFKVTATLGTRFKDRVFNTPISEAGIVGIGNGLALAGWRPVIEIMFSDFLLLAADQFVNHAAKFAWMYNGQVQVPIVIRTPSGGYRGYGPTHSQCIEKHLLGVPGTRVLALHKRCCPQKLYRSLLADNDRPTLVIENKLLYGQYADPAPPPGSQILATQAPFPTVRLLPAGPCQLTVVTYGGMVDMVESAIARLLETEELTCDLLIPTQLYPVDIEPIAESVHRTGRLLIVEEAQEFAGFGSEVIAQLAGHAALGAFRTRRVCAAPLPIPASKSAEMQSLPSIDRIARAAVELIAHR